MSYQGQDPNQQGQYPGQPGQPSQPGQPGQYGGYTPPQPQPTDPYSGQQPGYQPPYGQPPQGGYQQQAGYQQPYGAPQSAYGNLGPTSMNMDANVAAGLSYILSWVGGLIFFLMEKQNRFVRFHAMQSIILGGGYTILWLAVQLISIIVPILGLVLGCIVGLLGLVVVVASIICLVNAFQGKYFKLPIIGDYAERYANPAPPSPTL